MHLAKHFQQRAPGANPPGALAELSPMSKQEPEEEKWSEDEWKEWIYDEQHPDSEFDYLGKPRKHKETPSRVRNKNA